MHALQGLGWEQHGRPGVAAGRAEAWSRRAASGVWWRAVQAGAGRWIHVARGEVDPRGVRGGGLLGVQRSACAGAEVGKRGGGGL